MNKNFKQVITFTILMLFFAFLFTSCGTKKQQVQEKEIHYELITTLRDSLVITHEKREIITEKVVEKQEKADNYKRTDKDGTIHEYHNYNTDEKTIENVKELKETINILQTNNTTLTERLDASEKETNKLREQIDMFKLILQIAGAILVIYIIYRIYKKTTH